MHSPGVCGAILAIGLQTEAGAAEKLSSLINALNADTEMVLVAAAEAAEALAPVAWAHAAYLLQLAPGATEADALRALFQEALNRGRDAVLITTLEGPPLTDETVRGMVASYRAAGNEVWAIVSDHVSDQAPQGAAQQAESAPVYSVLLGRRMIELFLRGRQWQSAQEVLTANREHVRALNLPYGVLNEPSTGSPG